MRFWRMRVRNLKPRENRRANPCLIRPGGCAHAECALHEGHSTHSQDTDQRERARRDSDARCRARSCEDRRAGGDGRKASRLRPRDLRADGPKLFTESHDDGDEHLLCRGRDAVRVSPVALRNDAHGQFKYKPSCDLRLSNPMVQPRHVREVGRMKRRRMPGPGPRAPINSRQFAAALPWSPLQEGPKKLGSGNRPPKWKVAVPRTPPAGCNPESCPAPCERSRFYSGVG